MLCVERGQDRDCVVDVCGGIAAVNAAGGLAIPVERIRCRRNARARKRRAREQLPVLEAAWDAAIGRAMASRPLTVRIDLDRMGS